MNLVPVTAQCSRRSRSVRVVEDYLSLPQVIGRTIQVPAVATVVAVVLGGAVLGVLGAVLAIPLAGVILLLVREIVLPRLDRS